MKKRRDIGKIGITSQNLVYAILAALLIVTIIIIAYKLGIADYFKNLPDFSSTEEGKKAVAEQNSVPADEKFSFNKKYPTIRLIYLGIFSDNLISFRWNRNLDKPQVLISISSAPESEWLINSRLNEMFDKGRGIEDSAKSQIEYIMRSLDEDNLIERIAQTSNDRNIDIDFPYPMQETNPISAGRYAQLSEEEIKAKLKIYYPEFYTDKLEADFKEGKQVSSETFLLSFSKGINDDVFILWNFNSNRPKIIIRPNGNQILENGNEVWITNKGDVRKFLQKNGVAEKMYDSEDEPDISLIESLFDAKSPSQLSEKIASIMQRKNTYTKNGDVTVESLDKISVDMWMYRVTEPDNLFKSKE